MATKNRIETGAVILSEMAYKESSKILTAYTEKLGKISIMAKGVKGPKSSLISLAQTFTHGKYFLSEGRNFYYLNRGSLIHSNLNLRKSYDKMIYSSIIVEIVNRSTIEGQKNEKIYGLLSKTLSFISEKKEYKIFFLAFLLKYLSYMGYRPRIPKSYLPPMSFVIQRGGVLSGTCQEVGGYPMEEEDIYILNKLLYTSLDELFTIDRKKNFDKIFELLIHYVQVTLDIDNLHSLQFLL